MFVRPDAKPKAMGWPKWQKLNIKIHRTLKILWHCSRIYFVGEFFGGLGACWIPSWLSQVVVRGLSTGSARLKLAKVCLQSSCCCESSHLTAWRGWQDLEGPCKEVRASGTETQDPSRLRGSPVRWEELTAVCNQFELFQNYCSVTVM